MKKIGMFLLAAVIVIGKTGCGGGGDDFSPTVENMAGVYSPTKVTVTEGGVTATFLPPDLSGELILSTAGTYTIDLNIRGQEFSDSGTFAIVDSTITFDGGEQSGLITDDGRKFSVTGIVGGQTQTYDFTRS